MSGKRCDLAAFKASSAASFPVFIRLNTLTVLVCQTEHFVNAQHSPVKRLGKQSLTLHSTAHSGTMSHLFCS